VAQSVGLNLSEFAEAPGADAPPEASARHLEQ